VSIRYRCEGTEAVGATPAAAEYEIDVRSTGSGWRVTLGGEPLAAEIASDGAGCVEVALDGRRHRLYVARDGDRRWVFVGGRTLRLHRPDPDAEAVDETGVASPDIRAAMPGKVVKLLVAEGQTVAFGEPVIILESMKMESELTAPVDGTVATIHVEAGQTVGQDAPLVDIAPAAETGDEPAD
jgi:acetyl/propionyl-CoA carboxylase alpha subunit